MATFTLRPCALPCGALRLPAKHTPTLQRRALSASTTPTLPRVGADFLAGCQQRLLSFTSNGSQWFAMRHGKKIPKLGRPADQRKALIRSLVTQLLRHGRITTTKVKAKAIRRYVDRMIGLAKDGSLHARRQALGFVYDKAIVKSLFEEVPGRYGERNGGYTRIITEPRLRRGDAAEMAAIELV